jgi:hypothetical protein
MAAGLSNEQFEQLLTNLWTRLDERYARQNGPNPPDPGDGPNAQGVTPGLKPNSAQTKSGTSIPIYPRTSGKVTWSNRARMSFTAMFDSSSLEQRVLLNQKGQRAQTWFADLWNNA